MLSLGHLGTTAHIEARQSQLRAEIETSQPAKVTPIHSRTGVAQMISFFLRLSL